MTYVHSTQLQWINFKRPQQIYLDIVTTIKFHKQNTDTYRYKSNHEIVFFYKLFFQKVSGIICF